jgi:hypothetical protein
LLEREAVWNRVIDQHHELLLLKAYKDTLCHANIVDQPLVAKFELENKPGSNLGGLEAYKLILAAG